MTDGSAAFPVQAPRLLVLRSPDSTHPPSVRSREGFLDSSLPIRERLDEAGAGDLVTLAAAALAPSLLVLGEPGQGKTCALRELEGLLRASGAAVTTVEGSQLDDIGFDAVLDGAWVQLHRPDNEASQVDRVVIIDALDESPMLNRLVGRLDRALRSLDWSGIRWIVGCRTADVPPNLTRRLKRLTGIDPYVCELAPLRRQDAVQLLDAAGFDGAAIVEHAVVCGAGSLASGPLTLALLAQRRDTGQEISGSLELFNTGADVLLGYEPESVTTRQQRRAIAERIAAVMMLAGKRSVFAGPSLEAGDHDLEIGDIVGGSERAGGGEFAVSVAAVSETLRTAMFAGSSDRPVFAHSSHAALLAAAYLHNRQPRLPEAQLESLMLVAAPDASRAIPETLREVAAWLAALDDSHGRRLVDVDPEAFVGHQPYLDSPELRRSIVSGLLSRAGEFELSDRYWDYLDLNYSGLGDELAELLARHRSEPKDWHELTQCRVALRLSPTAQSEKLDQELERIGGSELWSARMGAAAVDGLLRRGSSAVPFLRNLLLDLSDRSHAELRDPDDELRGHLLAGLWPDQLTTDEVLPLLVPRQSELIGSYWMFLRQFPDRVSDADLEAVAAWAAGCASVMVEPSDRTRRNEAIGALDADLAQHLLHRLIQTELRGAIGTYTAVLAWQQLREYHQPSLPAEVPEHNRRALAIALANLRAGKGSARQDAQIITWEWGRSGRNLLDTGDLEWLIERSNSVAPVDTALAETYGELAAAVFNDDDRTACELVLAQEGRPVWPAFARWFAPIEIESERATRLREQHDRQARADIQDEPPEHVVALRSHVCETYEAVVGGEPRRLWELADLLQFNPETGRGTRVFIDDLLEFPGAALLPDDAAGRLADAAKEYLETEHDHGDDWLGTTKYDKRAWAGYLALALLERSGRFGELEPDHILRWKDAVIWFATVPIDDGRVEFKRELLRLLDEHDRQLLAERLVRFVRGEVRRGSSLSELEAFDVPLVEALLEPWIRLCREIMTALLAEPAPHDDGPESIGPLTRFASDDQRRAALHDWDRAYGRLADAHPDDALQIVRDLLERTRNERLAELAGRAIRVLIAARPELWPELWAAIEADEEVSTATMMQLAAGTQLLDELHEAQLADLYRWVSAYFVPDEDEPVRAGVHTVNADWQVRNWRDQILSVLSDRATGDALNELAALVAAYPARTAILYNLRRARAASYTREWTPPAPTEVRELLDDRERRLVRSPEELGELIESTLRRLDFNHTGQLLWDCHRHESGDIRWRPKPEAALSAFLKNELELRLGGRGVAVNREVVVRQTDAFGAGERVDLLVECRSFTAGSGRAESHRVVIEVKGCWHPDLKTAQATQLAGRYLAEVDATVGLYIVGWYPQNSWDRLDGRRRRAPESRDTLIEELERQARELSVSGTDVRPIVLTITRPTHPSPSTAAES